MNNKTVTNENYVFGPIVYAIQKAITEDLPNYTLGCDLETTNHRMLLRGDLINTNLRNILNSEELYLLSFDRYSWEARLVVDTIYKRVFCITTDNTIRRLSAKGHSYPHFSQTLVSILNKDLKGQFYQEELFCEDFSPRTYEKDMNILQESGVTLEAGYHFYYIVYTAQDNAISKLRMLLLDGQFTPVEETDLSSFITPEYPIIPEPISKEQLEAIHKEVTKSLVSLKPGVTPTLIEIAKEA